MPSPWIALICPVMLELDLAQKTSRAAPSIAAMGSVRMLRTVADYGGEGDWGPRWRCTYEISGSFGTTSFLMAQFITGEETLGSRFQLLANDGSFVLLSTDRARMLPGAGLDIFRNYDFADVHVTRANLSWDSSERKASNARAGGDFASAMFRSQKRGTGCARDLSAALSPEEAQFFVWGRVAQQIFNTLPASTSSPSERASQFVSCSLVQSVGMGRPEHRCNLTLHLKSGTLLPIAAASESTRNYCYYGTFERAFPSAARISPAVDHLELTGEIADIMARAGHRGCIKQPGSGQDTACSLRLR